MRILLITHVFLWLISGDERLSARWRAPIRDPPNEVYLSVVSIREAIVNYNFRRTPPLTSLWQRTYYRVGGNGMRS
jgi:PIN domain nuclease of toxin-antitoxin system